MRLRDYFAGECFRLRSPLSARTVAERINEAAGSALWPFAMGVVGGVWSGHIRLRYRSSLFEYNAKPVLAGRIREAPSGSSLDLRYRAPVLICAFYLIWYLFLAFFAVGFLANSGASEFTGGDKAMAVAILAMLFVAPVGLHAVGTRRSEEELAEMLDFLCRHAEAKR
jgi:hypothetical protein